MKLVNENGDVITCRELNAKASAALSEERIEIIQLLAQKPQYAAELARLLGMEEQALHYHMKLLQKAGLIHVIDYEERKGGVAKRFGIAADAFALVVKKEGWKSFTLVPTKIPLLFKPFIEEGAFNGKFVVGSPDPHGVYRARSSEFPMLELAMQLGRYATFSFPLYLLDTQVKELDRKENMILAGGPKVNTLTAEINNTLPISFDKKTFELYSRFSKKRYSGNIGVIELVRNPFSAKKRILFVGGLNHQGTRAAILGIIKWMDDIEAGNNFKPKIIAKVVEGFDDNGDGIVDTVEILE